MLVKLSDFGLVKDQASEFTRTQSEMKGTVRDPVLGSFKDYAVVNEMYSVGHVLAYIFTGREFVPPATDEVGRIIHKCAVTDVGQRYQAVTELVAEVERLEAPPVQGNRLGPRLGEGRAQRGAASELAQASRIGPRVATWREECQVSDTKSGKVTSRPGTYK